MLNKNNTDARIRANKKRESRKFLVIMCSLVFSFAAAIPVIVYIVKKKKDITNF